MSTVQYLTCKTHDVFTVCQFNTIFPNRSIYAIEFFRTLRYKLLLLFFVDNRFVLNCRRFRK